jgi:hypothetical protein
MDLKECEFHFPFAFLARRQTRQEESPADVCYCRMIILAALCLIPGHPGFVFKDNAVLKRTSEDEEPKLVQESLA